MNVDQNLNEQKQESPVTENDRFTPALNFQHGNRSVPQVQDWRRSMNMEQNLNEQKQESNDRSTPARNFQHDNRSVPCVQDWRRGMNMEQNLNEQMQESAVAGNDGFTPSPNFQHGNRSVSSVQDWIGVSISPEPDRTEPNRFGPKPKLVKNQNRKPNHYMLFGFRLVRVGSVFGSVRFLRSICSLGVSISPEPDRTEPNRLGPKPKLVKKPNRKPNRYMLFGFGSVRFRSVFGSVRFFRSICSPLGLEEGYECRQESLVPGNDGSTPALNFQHGNRAVPAVHDWRRGMNVEQNLCQRRQENPVAGNDGSTPARNYQHDNRSVPSVHDWRRSVTDMNMTPPGF